jgi:putative iron-dependent peroxidase
VQIVGEAEPQAVLSPLTEAAIFLVATVEPASEPPVRQVLSDLGALVRSVGFKVPEGALTCVVGVGSAAWDRLFGPPRPARLHPFQEVVGPKHTAVATPGDLLFHIRAQRFDLCFGLAERLLSALRGCVKVEDEVHGFKSFDARDLLGFVDGTENPTGGKAAAAVEVGDEDAGFRGGSYVVVQKYLHDLKSWGSLPVEDQEMVIGRTKLSDVELPDDVKPSNSHVALNTIVDEAGEEKEIFRLNMPFGQAGTGEYGTYYIAYAKDPSVIEEMLGNMFVGRPPGNYDRVLDFSTAVTGGLFFVPTIDFLESGGEAAHPVRESVPRPLEAPGGGSLSIGSLKGA